MLDILGILFMILALLTGPLPGPGGIPLFILGLGLLALNHTWAQRYIDLLKQYADKLGELIFVKNSRVQLFYDVIAPPVTLLGIWLLVRHSALWMVSLGIFSLFMGITIFLGNRQRWHKLKRIFKQSS